jgi:hypothetical protein
MNVYLCPLLFHCSVITLCLAMNTLCSTSTLTCPQQPSTPTKTELKTVSPEAGSHCFVHVILLEWSCAFTSRLGTLSVCWSTKENAGGLKPSVNERHASWYVTYLPFTLTCSIPINQKFRFLCLVCNLWLFSSVECVGFHSLPELSFEKGSSHHWMFFTMQHPNISLPECF